MNRKGSPTQLQTFAKKSLPARGESQIRQRGNLTVSIWQDNRPVVVIATNSDPTVMDSVKHKSRDRTRSSYSCPTSVRQYNKCMGGVDHNDQLRGYYRVFPRSKKYLFWFLVDLVITNSYILCLHHTDLRVDGIKDFRCTLAKQLIGDYHSRKQPGRSSTQLQPKRFCQEHFPTRGDDKPHRYHYFHCYRHQH